MDYNRLSIELHEKHKGKLEVVSKVSVENKDDLSIAYTPGVAEPCRRIHENRDDVYKYTVKGNMVAVVSDGTAVLGLGDIGPEASLPVMEGKAVLFKNFANVDAFPIVLNTKSVDEIVRTVELIAPGFGGINLEDIAAPRCFEIERQLKSKLDIPVFHDDQHGTAIVVAAGLINALKLKKQAFSDIEAVINGPGSAGIAIAKLLIQLGIKNVVLCGKQGILTKDMQSINSEQRLMLDITNKNDESGTLCDALKGKDVFIGVSAPNVVTEEMIASMNKDAVVFAMANPIPEIMPELAIKAGALVVGTGRSDFPNQVNNVLAFPGIFRGALDVRASDINESMKIAAAYAIAETIGDDEITPEYILPKAFDTRIAQNVSEAVKEAARKSGVARV
ncbi:MULTISPECIES: NADP-dependent malic enzyme [unclassified Fusibacter]|uniref:NAD(P)-dependent malic enzyme n=1 Tax=unclassified Fusibacter TaxID=2624464 RepID=UPI001011C8C7|nr:MULTISPECIES: NADP-dependent malic enzyme [unclassified Fusibacter]MCK8059536.1 NADP-dependent malic enzyme [Fusibacter sp. A2]NPE21000.1 NADP-dependent malic enzyme [Fusibacter sp. A1]RXV62274.1 NADP-dependent malic enzyme [Fusibacter sp. A1]